MPTPVLIIPLLPDTIFVIAVIAPRRTPTDTSPLIRVSVSCAPRSATAEARILTAAANNMIETPARAVDPAVLSRFLATTVTAASRMTVAVIPRIRLSVSF